MDERYVSLLFRFAFWQAQALSTHQSSKELGRQHWRWHIRYCRGCTDRLSYRKSDGTQYADHSAVGWSWHSCGSLRHLGRPCRKLVQAHTWHKGQWKYSPRTRRNARPFRLVAYRNSCCRHLSLRAYTYIKDIADTRYSQKEQSNSLWVTLLLFLLSMMYRFAVS